MLYGLKERGEVEGGEGGVAVTERGVEKCRGRRRRNEIRYEGKESHVH